MSFFAEQLDVLNQKGLRRQLNKRLDSDSSSWIIIDGKRVLNLCSNNYLGLANDQRIKEAAINAIKSYGVGAGASRLVSGDAKLHHDLEEKIAKFKKAQKCLVFNSGYTANIGIISALVKRGDIVFCDKLNHASIVDGIILSRAELRRYPHKDIDALRRIIANSTKYNPSAEVDECYVASGGNPGIGNGIARDIATKKKGAPDFSPGGSTKKLIITDSVFSMDGDIAPLRELIDLALEFNCMLMIDEAHATGVLGRNGRGALEFLGLEDQKEHVIQMGTLSKAIGGFGAYVCGTKDLIDYLINHSRSLIYSTALPPMVSAANIKALEIIKTEPQRRKDLMKSTYSFKKRLVTLGFDIGQSQTPIIPLITKEPKVAMEFSRRLFEEGVFVQGIRPPTVPQGQARLRIALMATHSSDDLLLALDKIESIGKELCLI